MKNLSFKLFAKALGNETRLEIIEELMKKEMSVNEICEKTEFEQSRVSHNLKCLLHCGFVKNKRKGKNVVYYISNEIKPIVKGMIEYANKYEKYLRSCGVVKNEL